MTSNNINLLLTVLLLVTTRDTSYSLAPSYTYINSHHSHRRTSSSLPALITKDGINWVDEFDDSSSSLNKNNNNINIKNNNSNDGKEGFQQRSTDDFRKPHGSVGVSPTYQRIGGNGWGSTFRSAFQTQSTDEFKRPHGMPVGMEEQAAAPPPKRVFKAPFQTSTTDDFKRSRDTGTTFDAPQQPLFNHLFNRPSRSQTTPYQNRVGQDSYESTQSPKSFSEAEIISDAGGRQSQTTATPPMGIYDPPIINDQRTPSWFGSNTRDPPTQNAQQPIRPSQVTPPMGTRALSAPKTITPEEDFAHWDKKLEVAVQTSSSTLIRPPRWPLVRDPVGVSSEYPLLMTRVMVTMLSTLSTRYLHLYNGYSPVLASSAMTLLVSTCFDRRLGQAAFCGSFAGMCGGHLVPNLSMTVALGALTSVCYEVLININNLCLGIGGRLGATAFLATSLLARYQKVGSVGRKMRRAMWKGGAGPSSIVVSMILFHVIGSVSTIFLRECSDDSAAADPVRASSVVGLVGSLFLSDPMSVLALYGGSFVGMSLPSRLMYGNAPGRAKVAQPQTALSLFTSFAGAGAIAGLIHAITIHSGYWNGGWGGKAGLCAFAGCWVYRGIASTFQFCSKRI